jgi:hypothetical protein
LLLAEAPSSWFPATINIHSEVGYAEIRGSQAKLEEQLLGLPFARYYHKTHLQCTDIVFSITDNLILFFDIISLIPHRDQLQFIFFSVIRNFSWILHSTSPISPR